MHNLKINLRNQTFSMLILVRQTRLFLKVKKKLSKMQFCCYDNQRKIDKMFYSSFLKFNQKLFNKKTLNNNKRKALLWSKIRIRIRIINKIYFFNLHGKFLLIFKFIFFWNSNNSFFTIFFLNLFTTNLKILKQTKLDTIVEKDLLFVVKINECTIQF